MIAPHFALCLEQTLGHRAHTLNLEREAAARSPRASVVRVEYPEGSRLPIPWALRGSEQARAKLRALRARRDVTLFHTSTVSLLAPSLRAPYVVSVDATPLQLDTMGEWYAHRRLPGLAEAAKRAWYRRVFGGARALIAWSKWSAESLSRDYGVPAERIVVAHPGAPAQFFGIERSAAPRTPTILFVGGDFARKGGDDLLAVFDTLKGRAKLVLVTGAAVPEMPGVEVVRGATPGSPALLDAFARADIFCLPTKGDCTSVAIEEAMAAGLPVVTTPVGSNSGTVRAGTGALVKPGDRPALMAALARLVDDAVTRRAWGAAAREVAREHYDAAANARLVLDTVEAAA